MSYSSTQNLNLVYESVTVSYGIVNPDPTEPQDSENIGFFGNSTLVTVNTFLTTNVPLTKDFVEIFNKGSYLIISNILVNCDAGVTITQYSFEVSETPDGGVPNVVYNLTVPTNITNANATVYNFPFTGCFFNSNTTNTLTVSFTLTFAGGDAGVPGNTSPITFVRIT